MEMLFHAHSGLRYLVLAAGAVALVGLAAGWLSSRPYGRGARILTAIFLGTLDLQILIGLALYIGGRRPERIHEHLAMALLAAAVGHFAAVRARKKERFVLALSGVLLALTFVAGGILAIRDSIF